MNILKHLAWSMLFGLIAIQWIKLNLHLLRTQEWFTIGVMIVCHFFLFIGIGFGLSKKAFEKNSGDVSSE